MLTKKGKYGLKALCHLLGMSPGDLAFVGEIAAARTTSPRNSSTPSSRSCAMPASCSARKGKTGGYSLARPASEIKIGHVVRARRPAGADPLRQQDALPAL
jgi:DNA-binding IscR family transcriptional regulator